MAEQARTTPWFLWPVVFPFRLVEWVLKLTGRLVGVILGAILISVGLLLTATVVGAIIGIPFAAVGALLVVRSLF